MSKLKIYELIEYYNNDELKNTINESDFDPNVLYNHKCIIHIAVLYNNYEAFEMLVRHDKFNKKDHYKYFTHRIFERINKYDCNENRKYLDLLIQIQFNFEIGDLGRIINNSELFMELFEYITSNMEQHSKYSSITDCLHMINMNYNKTTNNNIIETFYNMIKTDYNEHFTKENIDIYFLDNALRYNNSTMVSLIKNDFDILSCNAKNSIIYALNESEFLLQQLCKMKIETNTKYNENLISILKLNINDMFNFHHSYNSCVTNLPDNILERILLIAKNYDLLKQCFNDIHDNNDCNLVFILVFSIFSKYITRYSTVSKTKMKEYYKLIEFLLQNKITRENPFMHFNYINVVTLQSYNARVEDKLPLFKDNIKDICYIIFKYGFKPVNINNILILKNMFTESEIKNIYDENNVANILDNNNIISYSNKKKIKV